MEIKKRRAKVSKPRFNIEKSDLKWSYVFLVHRYNYRVNKDGNKICDKIKYSTGVKVITKAWKGNPIYRSSETTQDGQVSTKNETLDKIQTLAKEIISNNPSISTNDYKDRLDYGLGIKAIPKDKLQQSVLEYFQTYINKIEKQTTVSDRTVQKYKTALKLWNDYFETKTKINPQFEDITIDEPMLFADHFYIERNWSARTALKYISCLKTVMGDAYFQDYTTVENKKVKINTNDIFNNPKFTVETQNTTKPVLELEDLEKLFKYDLTDNPKLDRVRDLFLISAYGGGLRYSDFTRVKKDNFQVINGEKVLVMNTYKGRNTNKSTEVYIPVVDELEQLFVKHNYKSPTPISSQKMNNYIKDLCQLVEIDRNVVLKKSVAGKSVEITEPIYNHVTNHTARYTYINYMLNDYGIDPNRLKVITGQTLKTLLGYERSNKEKSALAIGEKVKIAKANIEAKKLRAV